MRIPLQIAIALLFVVLACGESVAETVVVTVEGKPRAVLQLDGAGEIVMNKVDQVVAMDGVPPDDPPQPPDDLGLTEFTKQKLEDVPDHSRKQTAARALSAIYLTVGEQYAAGEISRDQLVPTLDQAIESVLSTLGVDEHWETFIGQIKGKLTELELSDPREVNQALGEISAGLSENEAITDIIPSVIELIQAIIENDTEAIIQAVLKIVTELIGSEAASSAAFGGGE